MYGNGRFKVSNRLSIKAKARQLHKQNTFCLRVTENFQTRTKSEQKNCHRTPRKGCKEDDEKKEKTKTERKEKYQTQMRQR